MTEVNIISQTKHELLLEMMSLLDPCMLTLNN